jgi:penicillin-binding protein 1A
MKRVTGGGLPARLWRDFMIEAHGSSPPRPLTPGAPPATGKFWDRLFGG